MKKGKMRETSPFLPGSNPSGPTNLNSAVLCQNKPILRLLGCWRDECRKDKDLNGLLRLKAGEEKTESFKSSNVIYL
jgi:hypothetical protein